MPVNDMEWGGVYWSNWAGLSDVTSAMQVKEDWICKTTNSICGWYNQCCYKSELTQGGKVAATVEMMVI